MFELMTNPWACSGVNAADADPGLSWISWMSLVGLHTGCAASLAKGSFEAAQVQPALFKKRAVHSELSHS